MRKQRAQTIVIQNNKMLFGIGLISEGYIRHFFLGGGIEEGETPEEAALRELKEEGNVEGRIIFKIEEGDFRNHHTFLVDIGDQVPVLGMDPEEEHIKDMELRGLQDLEFISLYDFDKFTAIDLVYFELLIAECNKRNYKPDWLGILLEAIKKLKPDDAGVIA